VPKPETANKCPESFSLPGRTLRDDLQDLEALAHEDDNAVLGEKLARIRHVIEACIWLRRKLPW